MSDEFRADDFWPIEKLPTSCLRCRRHFQPGALMVTNDNEGVCYECAAKALSKVKSFSELKDDWYKGKSNE